MRLCFYFHVYLYMFLIYVFFCVSLQGEHHSHNGGEDVTSRQHDWCGRHGPPWTHDWRIIHREPEETLRPQWDLCKSSGNNAVVTITPNKLFGFCVCVWGRCVQPTFKTSIAGLKMKRSRDFSWLYCSRFPQDIFFLLHRWLRYRDHSNQTISKSHHQGMAVTPFKWCMKTRSWGQRISGGSVAHYSNFWRKVVFEVLCLYQTVPSGLQRAAIFFFSCQLF